MVQFVRSPTISSPLPATPTHDRLAFVTVDFVTVDVPRPVSLLTFTNCSWKDVGLLDGHQYPGNNLMLFG